MQVKVSEDLDVRRLILPDKAGKKERKGLCKTTKHTKDVNGFKRKAALPISPDTLIIIEKKRFRILNKG